MKKAAGFLLLVFFLACSASSGADEATLFVNMTLPDGRVLIYAGSKDGVKKGVVYEAQRDGSTVATVEITDVQDFVSYGEVKDKKEDVREMDVLVPTEVKGKEEKKKDDEKKEDKKKKKETKKEDDKDKDKKDTKKKEDKEKAEEKTAKKEEKPAGPQIRRGVEYELPSHYGTIGVMMMPTAHKLPRGRVAVALSHISLERVDTASGTSPLDSSQNSIGVAVGLDDNFELAYYHAQDQSIGMAGAVPVASRDINVYMVKYKFGKRYMYNSDSVRNVHYAVEVARYVVEDDKDVTRFTGLFSYHHPNFASHLGLYKLTDQRDDEGDNEERDTGLMAGIELPMGKELSLIGQFDLFRKENFYAGGARYQYEKWGTIEAGMLGLSYDRAFMISASHIF